MAFGRFVKRLFGFGRGGKSAVINSPQSATPSAREKVSTLKSVVGLSRFGEAGKGRDTLPGGAYLKTEMRQGMKSPGSMRKQTFSKGTQVKSDVKISGRKVVDMATRHTSQVIRKAAVSPVYGPNSGKIVSASSEGLFNQKPALRTTMPYAGLRSVRCKII